MPPPPYGEENPHGTLNNAQIVLSDEDDSISKSHSQLIPAVNLMDVEYTSNGKSNSCHSAKTVEGVSDSQKMTTPKLFSEDADKYNTDFIYVFIEKTNQQNMGRLHPLLVGHILHKKLCVKNIISIKSVGRNRIKVHLNSTKDANALVSNKLLEAENLRAFIPNHLLEKKGLIRGVDTFFDTNYLKSNIISNVNILELQRMQRKTEKEGKEIYVPKQTIIITFEGNTLPNEVVINSVMFPVELFYGKVTQCYFCLKYGHISKQCRSTNSLCISCGKLKSENHTCLETDTFCIHCKTNDHNSVSKKCAFFEKQKKIKKIMVENNVTFNEAKEYCDNSFANFASINKFSPLSNLENYESNFPRLNKDKNTFSVNQKSNTQSKPHRVNIKPLVSFSQPTTSKRYEPSTSNNKKRKISVTPPASPMFPFRFSASTPIPPSSNVPQYHLNREKNTILEYVSNFLVDFLGQIKSLSDIKKLDIDAFKRSINLVLDETLNPQ